jgi:hypothetical protein
LELFLMVAAMSLLGVAASVALFAAATHDERAPRPGAFEETVLLGTPRFFAAGARAPQPPPLVPIEVLLLQIQRHVQLEQAAAESFHHYPTAQALHMQTLSPLVH